VVGGGLSALFHLGLLALLATGPRTIPVGVSSQSIVTIDLRTTTVEPPPEPAPASKLVQSEGRSWQGLRPVSRRLPTVPVEIAPESAVTTLTAPELGEPDDDGEELAEPEAAPAAAPLATAPEAAAPVTPTKAPVIAPEAARALRVYDTFPMLLAQASLSRAEFLVEVCVSDHGQVSDAVIAEGTLRSSESTLRTAIRSWRYRPLVVNGAPTPFCHFMRIKYAMN
jgi:hypothetical protein